MISVGRASARPCRHLHGELPGDVGRRAPGVGLVVVPAHGGRHGHARSVGVALSSPSSDGIPVWPFFVAAGVIVAAGAILGGATAEVTRQRAVAGGALVVLSRVRGGVGVGPPAELAGGDAGARAWPTARRSSRSAWPRCRCSTSTGTAVS